ncbi:hypothetical protein HBB16_17345 [Pseudonocardia sp. MCCB 268]|nr:hypothetical protein [Pseudonocardia cytotoxica]
MIVVGDPGVDAPGGGAPDGGGTLPSQQRDDWRPAVPRPHRVPDPAPSLP